VPLREGSSPGTIAKNIASEVDNGRPQKQAIAIAYAKAGKRGRRKKGKRA